MRTPRLATEDSHYHIKRRRDKGGNRILSPVKIENVEGGRPQSVVADGWMQLLSDFTPAQWKERRRTQF